MKTIDNCAYMVYCYSTKELYITKYNSNLFRVVEVHRTCEATATP